MFLADDLKPNIEITQTTVECPVKDCTEKVRRQRQKFKLETPFQCQRHKLYISPSTFEYADETENLLWTDAGDLALLKRIKEVKRESRKAREKSEDAVTWNVFRFLEKTNQLSNLLTTICSSTVSDPQLMYWSYCGTENCCWPHLMSTRNEFGEIPKRGSEPDLIIISQEALFWIEAKLTSTNRTTPSQPKEQKRYLTGGEQWANEVFTSDFQTIAVDNRKYELFRLWLLGSWVAKRLNRKFYLINLVRSGKDVDVESVFRPLLRSNQDRTFVRYTWEDIYDHVLKHGSQSSQKELLLSYYRGKTIGYVKGKLKIAFAV